MRAPCHVSCATNSRFGLHWRVDTKNGVIPEGYAIFDLPGFFIQNGINLYERQNDPSYAVENY